MCLGYLSVGLSIDAQCGEGHNMIMWDEDEMRVVQRSPGARADAARQGMLAVAPASLNTA